MMPACKDMTVLEMTNSQSTQTLNERLEFIGLDDAQRQTLATLAPTIAASLDGALDTFYARARKTPEAARFFSSEAHIQHAKNHQIHHWNTIASGRFDAAYVEAVSTIGRTHARLGLEPRWYIGGYALILESIISAVVGDALKGFPRQKKRKQISESISAVIKAAMVDMDYSISTYLEALALERDKAASQHLELESQQKTALAALDHALSQLAEGDLSAPLTQDLAANFASLKTNYNTALESLNAAMTDISVTAGAVLAQSEQISAATENMAKRTENQASALEETAAALEEISTIAKEAETRTTEIHNAVRESAAEAIKSSSVVEQAAEAMSAIEQSSRRMTQVIGVIDEIAFQTNLLALNAGVEAARAGESGRGFAVVAQEVRELAQRSANAAKEIKVLIGKSTEDVARGVGLVHSTGLALRNIGERVQSINGVMTAIAQSSREQSVGVGEINSAIGNMDLITQQNAAMVEQTSAATQKMSDEARHLSDLVSAFRLERDNVSQRPRAGRQQQDRSPAIILRQRLEGRLTGTGGARGSWEEF
jgi:methyl-accepting chemotaxis protein